ncbi:MAG TPA: hypothetical protein VFA28_02845 [Bryobacteraceae bacterium]|jgi:hypothetical protein|nr:hypothetical protein [Bryobacteraceae bacterium]
MQSQFLILLVGLIATGIFAVLIARLAKQSRVGPIQPEFIDSFSISRYRPMERLLSEADYRFLASQPGYHPSVSRKLRVRRRKVFRAYLAAISRDFERLYATGKQVAVYSEHDRADFIALLVRQKVLFELALMLAYARLALSSAGIGTVNVRGLLEALDQISDQVRHFRPASAPLA